VENKEEEGGETVQRNLRPKGENANEKKERQPASRNKRNSEGLIHNINQRGQRSQTS